MRRRPAAWAGRLSGIVVWGLAWGLVGCDRPATAPRPVRAAGSERGRGGEGVEASSREREKPPLEPGRPQYLPTVALRVGARRVTVEVAHTAAQRAHGLMFRTDLGPDDGMLFVFPRPQPLSFWMKNTPSPLSIAFADEDGVIVRIADMEPFDLRPVDSGAPAVLALEMPRGWFRRQGIVEGDRIMPLEPLPQAE